jgi:hypothetical protein
MLMGRRRAGELLEVTDLGAREAIGEAADCKPLGRGTMWLGRMLRRKRDC